MITYILITDEETIETKEIKEVLRLQRAFGGKIYAKVVEKGKIHYNPPLDF